MTTNVSMQRPPLSVRLAAEGLGSFLVVAVGVGTALFIPALHTETAHPMLVALIIAVAFGGAFVVSSFAFGAISGGHFTPVLSVGAAAAAKLPWRDVPAYVVAQLVGAAVAATLLTLVGTFGRDNLLTQLQDAGFASNGWGEYSPAGFELPAVIIAEVVVSGLLVLVFVSAHRSSVAAVVVPVAVGTMVMLAHLVMIPIDGASLNPARSLATAIYGGLGPIMQVWAFIVFPLLGAVAAGWACAPLLGRLPDATQPTPPLSGV
ncbi:aquaporin [Microbacterium sp. YY-01]|uniref:aquaporin n=1 Tax=Microbacterium sp. YY-01 TaxID=3421634 RepID=UPI003D1856E4